MFENFSVGDAKQWLWSFGLERKKESRWWFGEREQKRRKSFDFARERWCLGGGLKFFRGIFVFSGV